jgi:hypothetical protein
MDLPGRTSQALEMAPAAAGAIPRPYSLPARHSRSTHTPIPTLWASPSCQVTDRRPRPSAPIIQHQTFSTCAHIQVQAVQPAQPSSAQDSLNRCTQPPILNSTYRNAAPRRMPPSPILAKSELLVNGPGLECLSVGMRRHGCSTFNIKANAFFR